MREPPQLGDTRTKARSSPPVDHNASHIVGPAFIDALSVEAVLYPAGYRDRYGHPHAEVMERFAYRGILQANTASLGAIRLRLGRSTLAGPCAWRGSIRRYWQRPSVVADGVLPWSGCRDGAE